MQQLAHQGFDRRDHSHCTVRNETRFQFLIDSAPLRCRRGHGTMAAMAQRSKVGVFLVVVAIASIAVLSIILRHQLRCAGFPGPGITAADLPKTPDSENDLRIVAWNVRNFPLDERPQDPDLAYSRRTNICDFETAFGYLGHQELQFRFYFGLD